jgi:hypothetical protein
MDIRMFTRLVENAIPGATVGLDREGEVILNLRVEDNEVVVMDDDS